MSHLASPLQCRHLATTKSQLQRLQEQIEVFDEFMTTVHQATPPQLVTFTCTLCSSESKVYTFKVTGDNVQELDPLPPHTPLRTLHMLSSFVRLAHILLTNQYLFQVASSASSQP
jgi:hypothetical protein